MNYEATWGNIDSFFQHVVSDNEVPAPVSETSERFALCSYVKELANGLFPTTTI